LLPLFTEIEFFGVKFKKEVDKAKAEIKESLHDMRMQITDLKVSNSLSNNIQIGSELLPIAELNRLIASLGNNSNDSAIRDYPSKNVVTNNGEQHVYLFKVRYEIEQRIRRIYRYTSYIDENVEWLHGNYIDGRKHFRPLGQMINFVARSTSISGSITKLMMQVIEIANRGIHGEKVDEDYIVFVQKVMPEIIQELERIDAMRPMQ